MSSHLHDELDTFWIDEARVSEEALEERGNTREGTARHVTTALPFPRDRNEYANYQVLLHIRAQGKFGELNILQRKKYTGAHLNVLAHCTPLETDDIQFLIHKSIFKY